MKSKRKKFDLEEPCTEFLSVTDAEPISASATFASSAEDSTAITATAGTLSQSAYLELREKLLASAPKKVAKRSCSPEIQRQKMIEAMEKKRIPAEGGKSIAARLYERRR